MNSQWIKFIGIPYKQGGRPPSKELDCWGFALLVYKEIYNINLPLYSNIDVNNAPDNIDKTDLYSITSKHSIANEGDLLIFNVAGAPTHIGVALDNQMMIHCDLKVGSTIEDFRSSKWINRLNSINRIIPSS